MIEPLIVALREMQPDLTSDQIADIVWLALQRQQIMGILGNASKIDDSTTTDKPPGKDDSTTIDKPPGKDDSTTIDKPPGKDDSTTTDKPPEIDEPQKSEEKVPVYPQTATRDKDDRPIQVVDVPSLREPLTLTRALKALMQRVPFGEPVRLDEGATVRRIAEEQLWLPVLTAPLEPWLEVALVIDESPSMRMLWQKTLGDLKKILEHYGGFRDVQTWGLVTVDKPSSTSNPLHTDHTDEPQPPESTSVPPSQPQQVKLRRGLWTTAHERQYREPKALIDPNGRRLILVVSDCISSMWQQPGGSVFPALNLWANNGPVAIVQVMPTWLWSRTRLEDAIAIEVCSREPGIANQYLQAKAISFWDEEEFEDHEKTKQTKIKVPVLSLDPRSAASWSGMVMGWGSTWSRGVAFEKPPPQKAGPSEPDSQSASTGLDSGIEEPEPNDAISPEDRVQQFRMSSSPTARKLAGYLAASPVINLPVVRLLQFTMLPESRQAHVAEVFLGGLLQAIHPVPITADTNPEAVLYDFVEGVRDIVLDTLPTVYQITVLEEISQYVETWLGKALGTFGATVKESETDSSRDPLIKPFAKIRQQLWEKFQDGPRLSGLLNTVVPDLAYREVLQNGDASQGLEGWEIIANGGDGWLVEHGPGAECPATPGDSNFATSFEWCRKSQLIDLLAAGLTAEELDLAPEINISDWMCARSDCESQYYFKAELRDADQQVLATYETGEMAAPLAPGWKHPFQKVEHTFKDYGESLRFIYFEHGGKDKSDKDKHSRKGHYGAKMTGASVKVFLKAPTISKVFELLAGEYICAVKWGGDTGTWQEGTEHLVLSPQGELQFTSRSGTAPIQNLQIDGNTLSWSFEANPTAAEFTFKAGSDEPYFWDTPQSGQVFEGWLQYPDEGRIDFRGKRLQTFTFDVVKFVEEEIAEVEEEIVEEEDANFMEPLGDAPLEMIAIPSGRFLMGSPDLDSESLDSDKKDSDKKPRHPVTIPAFFMGKYPVTQAQWRFVAGLPQQQRALTSDDPSFFKGDNLPVETVSWHDAMEFCDRLSQHTGRRYRLPSEAEWEYACRAGTTTPFYFGETITFELANYSESKKENYHKKTTKPVGSYPPNAFGLYDMHGNVWEWCADHWHDNYEGAPPNGSAWTTGGDGTQRLLRGGSWNNYAEYCRSEHRIRNRPDSTYHSNGFRVVSSASST